MPVNEKLSEAVVANATPLSLTSFFTVAGTANPAYLVVNALDRNEYTGASSGATGSFSGNGATLALAGMGGDGRGAGIVFTWQATTGQYVNATYGTLAQLAYTPSLSANDVTSLSLFGTSSASQAQACASNAYALMTNDASGYIGSATIVTDAIYTGTPPASATPNLIASAADSFVGHAWNMDGCWVLASTIAAEAGASLPVQSTAIGVSGHANGEWFTLFNGPAGAGGNWQNLVSTGDVVCFTPAGGGGHITTCVAGSGSTAQLIDNITYINPNGSIANAAQDGSSQDILVSAAHAASQEFAGVKSASVVIYALDTPLVSDVVASASGVAGSSLALSPLLKITDPAGKAVTSIQLYDSLTGGSFVNGGKSTAAHSAAAALTVTSLSAVSLTATQPGTDTLEVRAFNGSYWGDWQTLAVTIAQPAAPRLTAPTPNQTWKIGSHVALTLPAGLFVDPQHQSLTYSASLATLSASAASPVAAAGPLPAWLTFNAAKRSFIGNVPASAAGTLPITVTATDLSGLSASETFAVTIAGPPAAAVTGVSLTPVPTSALLFSDWPTHGVELAAHAGQPHAAGAGIALPSDHRDWFAGAVGVGPAHFHR